MVSQVTATEVWCGSGHVSPRPGDLHDQIQFIEQLPFLFDLAILDAPLGDAIAVGNGSDSHAYNVVLINFFQNSVMCDSLVVIRELLKRDRNYQIFFMKILWQRFFRGIRESFLPRM